MSDTPRKDQDSEQIPEQIERSAEGVNDLPDKSITDQDAQAVKGGLNKTVKEAGILRR